MENNYWKDENEYYETLKRAMDDPNILGFFSIKRRGRSEDFGFRCYLMVRPLIEGKSILILSLTEDQRYIDRVVWQLKNIHRIEVDVERRTKQDPPDPLEVQYNAYGEVSGMRVVEQSDKFIGWRLTRKTDRSSD